MTAPVVTARYLDVPAAAAYLSLSESAVRNMVGRRTIPFVKLGRRLRFDVTDLDLWMRRQRIETTGTIG